MRIDDDFVFLFQLKLQSLRLRSSSSSSATLRDDSRDSRISRRDERKLDNQWMIARTLDTVVEFYTLFFLRQKSNVCSHCKIYQYDEKCRERFEKQKYWYCCSNDRVLIDTMNFEDDFETLKTLSKNQKKKILKNRKTNIKRDLQNCMYEIRIDFDEKKHRTKISREF